MVVRPWLVLAFAFLGCRQPSAGPTAAPDAGNDDAPSQDQLFEEQQRIAKGEDVGASWRAPRIVVDARGLTHNGVLLAPRAALPATLTRIEPLYTRLHRDREHWIQLRPGVAFTGSPEVQVDGDLAATTLAAVMKTIAAARYLEPTLRVGATSLALKWRDDAKRDFEAARVTLLATGYELRFEGGSCYPYKRLRTVAGRAELHAALEEGLLCKGRAAGFGVIRGPGEPASPAIEVLAVTARPGSSAAEVTAELAAILARPCLQPAPRVDLETTAPLDRADPRDAGACP